MVDAFLLRSTAVHRCTQRFQPGGKWYKMKVVQEPRCRGGGGGACRWRRFLFPRELGDFKGPNPLYCCLCVDTLNMCVHSVHLFLRSVCVVCIVIPSILDASQSIPFGVRVSSHQPGGGVTQEEVDTRRISFRFLASALLYSKYLVLYTYGIFLLWKYCIGDFLLLG